MRNMPLVDIAKALHVEKSLAAEAARQGEQQGWLKFWAGHSVCLTKAGQQLAQSRHDRKP
jgi:Mn-dependent DtxR family transcriptional regulator